MTFKDWMESEAGQRALEYAESAPGAGLSMAWDAAIAEAVRVCKGMTKEEGGVPRTPDAIDAGLLLEKFYAFSATR